jgi:hypothetical protein
VHSDDREGKQFLFLIRNPPSYSYIVKSSKVLVVIQEIIHLRKREIIIVYSKQLNNCHSFVIIPTKYMISTSQLFIVFVKDANISHIIQYYQIPMSQKTMIISLLRFAQIILNYSYRYFKFGRLIDSKYI